MNPITKRIAFPVNCPDCGKYKGSLFSSGEEKNKKNEHCKCHNKNNGIGFDINVKAVNLKDVNDQMTVMAYFETTCSGIENNWKKNSVRCPICNTFQFQIKNGDNGINMKCINPDCPTIGFDYVYNNNVAFVTASGIVNDFEPFLNEKYNESGMGQRAPINRSNRY